VRPHPVIIQFWLRFFSVLACVLDCACRDNPSWRGHSCVMGDNQRSRGVVIARNRSLEALDHQRRDLHSIKLSYLTEDRASSTIRLYPARACILQLEIVTSCSHRRDRWDRVGVVRIRLRV
jgi:hypothetical protein